MFLRRLLYLGVSALAALAAAAPAAADKPDRFPVEPFDETFEAGELCPFAISWVDERVKATTKVFYDKEGAPRFLIGSGAWTTRITNLENGESVVLNVSGPAKITLHDDGSQTLEGGGNWLLGFFPTDTPAGPMMLYSQGRLTLHVSPTGTLTLVDPPPRAVDICDVLAD